MVLSFAFGSELVSDGYKVMALIRVPITSPNTVISTRRFL